MAAKKIVLTPEQEAWLCEAFPVTASLDVCKRLGICLPTLYRLVRELGLKKDKDYIRGIGHKFEKGYDSWAPLDEEGRAARRKSMSDKMKNHFRVDRARASFGLTRLTKLRVITTPRKKVSDRCYLKKCGYILDEANVIAYWTPETRRATRLEAAPRRFYKFAQLPETT